MEVVRSNFLSVLPQVENAVNQCSFVAIDTEFTGLAVTSDDQPTLFDSMSDRYQRLRRTAETFMICQFGLSAFVKEKDANRYVAHTFNFYLCPHEQGSLSPRFSIQASNAEFLCDHNFDFNKWFYGGLPYCTQQQETILMAENKAGREKRKRDIIGFSYVFQLLVKSKKPLLGHNMLLDLAFMLEKFHNPLPAQYEQFKKTLHGLFPVIVDTKNLCHGLRKKLEDTNMLEFSNLQELYDALQNPKGACHSLFTPDVCHADSSTNYVTERCFHEAGYDAYCVGVVFLRLAHLLAMKGVSSADARPIHCRQYMRLTKPYSNRINISWGPVNYIDLVGADPPPRQRGLLIVTSRSGEQLTEELLHDQLGNLGRMEYQLLRPDCAVVALPNQRRATEILQDSSVKLDKVSVRLYNKWKDSHWYPLVWKALLPASGVLMLVAALYLARSVYQ